MYDISTVARAFVAEPIILPLLTVSMVLLTAIIAVVGVLHVLAMVRGEQYVADFLSGTTEKRRKFKKRYERESLDGEYRKWKRDRG